MPKYRVFFNCTATKSIEVEAEDQEAALDVAYEEFDYEGANVSNGFELDDNWEALADAPLYQFQADTLNRLNRQGQLDQGVYEVEE